MTRKGFTLLEILLATAIAAGISTMLIALWNQMIQSQLRVERFADLYSRAGLMYAQLDRDISGAFVPLDTELKETGTGSAKIEKIENVFVGDSSLKQLTFITNNPMQKYWSDRVGKPQPRVARVVYALVPEKKRSGSFVLMRQESGELDLTLYTTQDSKIRSYQLITGIKSVTMEYAAMVPKKQQANQKEQSQKEPEFEHVIKKEWKQVKEGEDEQKLPLIAHWITMNIELWDDTYTRATSFTFVFKIIPSFDSTTKPVPKPKAVIPSKQRTLTDRIRSPQPSGPHVQRQTKHRRPQTTGRHVTTHNTHRDYLAYNSRSVPLMPTRRR